MLGNLNPEQIDYVLHSQVVGRIGCAAAGRVYLVPITYVYDGQYLYCHTREGLKVQMMRQNPQICFEVDIIQDMAHWQCVIIQGQYQELSGQEGQDARRMLLNRISPLLVSETSMPGGSQEFHQPLTGGPAMPVTFRIEIKEKSGRYEKR
ncbi:MAG: pyridoxamine 5'-phosphate oxidase family protein [Adhaeribacter sp.]